MNCGKVTREILESSRIGLDQRSGNKVKGKDRENTGQSKERSCGRHVWTLGSRSGPNRNDAVRRSTPTPSVRLHIQEPTSADETALEQMGVRVRTGQKKGASYLLGSHAKVEISPKTEGLLRVLALTPTA